MPSDRPTRRPRSVALAAAIALAGTLTTCGHPMPPTSTAAPVGGDATGTSAASTEPAGTFGELGQVCGPGTPSPSKARGVTDSEIRIGVLNDADNTVVPGLGHQYLEVAQAFAKWCNAAGGIGGRKLVIHNRSTQLFNAAAAVLDACQSDFMLVGGGAAFDAPTVEPRTGCGLGAIPASNPAHDSQVAPLQAIIGRTSDTEANIGLFRLLDGRYHDAFEKIGILAIDTPDLRIPYERLRRVLDAEGWKVTSFQAGPPSLDNVRTYVQPLVGKAETLIMPVSLVEIFRAVNDVGYDPKVIVDPGGLFYNQDTVESFQKVPLNSPLYSASWTYPLDLAAKNSTAAKLVELEKAAFGKADESHVGPWITWLLFATAANGCSTLTVECVIGNATKDTAYTAGGLMAPIDLSDPAKLNVCIQLSTVSKDGVVYDEKDTAPTDGPYNCDPANLVPIPKG
jgi:hypothetical protein